MLIHLLLYIVVVGCGAQRNVIAADTARDSVSVVVHESIIYRDTTIYVEVPAESDKAILPDSDTSHLETSIASSEAWVSDGKLNHTLSNKKDIRLPKIMNMPIYLQNKKIEHLANHTITKEIEVEKELTQWQSFRMMLGTIVILLFASWLLFRIVKNTLLK